MKSFGILSSMSLFTALASGYIRTHTFRQLGPEGHNISVERSISGVEIKHHNFGARADDDDDLDTIRWKKAVCKGDELLDAMAGDEKRAGQWFKTPKESGESEYQDFSGLAKWGYGDAAWDDYYDLDASLPIKKALAGLGVDTRTIKEDGHNRCMQLEHEVEVAVDGTTYTPTAAYFTTVFNPVEGVIIAWGSYGARYMGLQQKPPVTVLPKLQSWSDIAWLQWKRIAGEKAKDLRFVFRSSVANTEAQWLINRALKQSGKELKIWPGVEFDMTTEEGRAILSSPNGAGVAYLLFTHKRHLDRKTISKVTVFADDGKKQPRPPSLIYHIVDAPPKEREGDKSAVKRTDSVLEKLAKYFEY